MKTRGILIVLALALTLLATPQFTAMPTGIGSAGNDGCSCHGGASDLTEIVVVGLPETFNASEVYEFSMTIEAQEFPRAAEDSGRLGGYRILATASDGSSGGLVEVIPSDLGHEMDGGLTHTSDGNMQRSWNFTWTAPADDSVTVTMRIYGNAVNGGDGSGGDHWNQEILNIGGINASGTSAPPLTILMTAILLAIIIIGLGVMWNFYQRDPESFSMQNFWSYLKPWLSTTDHKEVGIMYFLFGMFFFLVGGLLALLFRIQLALPENDFLSYDEYNSFFTLHGTTMIFLAAMPMIAGFMNYILPLQIGAYDLAFPRINALGLWILVFSTPLIFTGVWTGEAADITWVMYPPYSSLNNFGDLGNNPGTTAFISGILMLGASSTLSGVNFITTVFTLRARGVDLMKMPLFTWSVFVSVFMLYVSLPAFVVGVAFLMLDHTMAAQFYTFGGDPLLFQHLFWFFGHPEVYVVVIPAFGIVSEVLATSARRSIFGYKSMVFAMAGIGVVGFVVWGHHMLTSGMSPFWRSLFMVTTMLVAVPTGAKIFNWIWTLQGGSIKLQSHTMWSLGFLITFTLGGLSGMFFPVAGLDIHFHDSYFVVAHFHYVFIGGIIFALFSGTYYWFPKVTGKKMDERLGLWHFLIGFTSYNAAFWPMHALGIQGMPRRTHTYLAETGWAEYNMTITIFAIIFGLSQLIFVWNIIKSASKGDKVENDPWGGWSLEWSTTSPPPTPSFAEMPTLRVDTSRHHGDEDKAGFVENLVKGKEVSN